jgi:hypothetical protein
MEDLMLIDTKIDTRNWVTIWGLERRRVDGQVFRLIARQAVGTDDRRLLIYKCGEYYLLGEDQALLPLPKDVGFADTTLVELVDST